MNLKTIVTGVFSKFHDNIKLSILPALLEVYLTHFLLSEEVILGSKS